MKLVGGGFLQRDNNDQLCIVDAQGMENSVWPKN